jgi:tRNA (guanine-N7-)-methyltransferase
MSRRALRKIDPTLDLSRHLKSWDELPRPWNALELFGRAAPLEVEVGTGKGLFLQSAAAVAPGCNFLGVEISHKYARVAAARLMKQSLRNAMVVDGDAQRLFAELLPAQSLSAVHVYFPDPWWKKRHHKRRVMNERFVRDVARTLVPHGVLHFWTDVQEYFAASLALIAEHTALVDAGDVKERLATHELDYRTHYERRIRLGKQPVYRAEFRDS